MPVTFGPFVAARRKQLGMSQRELASRVLREDGKPITPQYLNDIERDRRNPPSDRIVEQLAFELEIEPDKLYFLAKRLPPDVSERVDSLDAVPEAFIAFRRAQERGAKQWNGS